jgi:hypothetical protein
MKNLKMLLQAIVAVAALAFPAAASAQPTAYPYQPGFQSMLSPFPVPGIFGEMFENTALDPYATTVHVVPPQGGTVMLYRNNALSGWWLQPGLVSVKPDVLYSLVATRGKTVVFASGIVFRPGYTDVAWRGDALPQIAYQPTWPMYPGNDLRYADQDRYDEHNAVGHSDYAEGHSDYSSQNRSNATARTQNNSASPASAPASARSIHIDRKSLRKNARTNYAAARKDDASTRSAAPKPAASPSQKAPVEKPRTERKVMKRLSTPR